MLRELNDRQTPVTVQDRLGTVARRFSHSDDAESVLRDEAHAQLAVVTGFGPTNAPTAGTLSVMLGIVELQRQLGTPMTVVISELGAWNSRKVPWRQLELVRDQMLAFLKAIGFETDRGTLRSHLDYDNLARAGRLARYLERQDFLDHREDLLELYDKHGVLGGEVGITVDALYTVADILGPVESGYQNVLMVSGLEEAYFTQLARLVLERQALAGQLTLDWAGRIGALYFRVLEGLGGYPKMSKSIPASSIHLGMGRRELSSRILAEDEISQPALLSAIELSSGWNDDQLDAARAAFGERSVAPGSWRDVKHAYMKSFFEYVIRWADCAS